MVGQRPLKPSILVRVQVPEFKDEGNQAFPSSIASLTAPLLIWCKKARSEFAAFLVFIKDFIISIYY
jgi:hypothetical protein